MKSVAEHVGGFLNKNNLFKGERKRIGPGDVFDALRNL